MTSTVLIVDDSTINRTLFREMLAELPCRILEAADGFECMRVAHDNRPSLVIMDIQMPRLDGLSATRMLRHDPECAAARVLLLSGDGSAECRSTAQKAGCDAFLAKPFSRAALLGAARRLLEEAPR